MTSQREYRTGLRVAGGIALPILLLTLINEYVWHRSVFGFEPQTISALVFVPALIGLFYISHWPGRFKKAPGENE